MFGAWRCPACALHVQPAKPMPQMITNWCTVNLIKLGNRYGKHSTVVRYDDRDVWLTLCDGLGAFTSAMNRLRLDPGAPACRAFRWRHRHLSNHCGRLRHAVRAQPLPDQV